MLHRIMQALWLDPRLYAEIQADSLGTRHALIAVLLVAVSHDVGGAVRATVVATEVPRQNFLLVAALWASCRGVCGRPVHPGSGPDRDRSRSVNAYGP